MYRIETLRIYIFKFCIFHNRKWSKICKYKINPSTFSFLALFFKSKIKSINDILFLLQIITCYRFFKTLWTFYVFNHICCIFGKFQSFRRYIYIYIASNSPYHSVTMILMTLMRYFPVNYTFNIIAFIFRIIKYLYPIFHTG